MTRLAKARLLAKTCEDQGLTPFDLCSWGFLLVLTERAGDLDWTHQVQEELEAAIQRKAADLDEEKGIDFHRTIVGAMTTPPSGADIESATLKAGSEGGEE